MIRELSGKGHRLADLLAASGVPASTYHYNKAKGPKAPTRPELWEGVAEVFSRTANGCGVTVNIVCATFANLFRQACQCKCAMCANAFPPIPAWPRFRYRSLLFSAGKSLSL